jgi:hypothetical protein
MNEFDAIFDAVAIAGKISAMEYKVREKREQLKEVAARKCGNCGAWMTSYCKPEKERGQFKSMNSIACSAFGTTPSLEREIERYRTELGELIAEHEAIVADLS